MSVYHVFSAYGGGQKMMADALELELQRVELPRICDAQEEHSLLLAARSSLQSLRFP